MQRRKSGSSQERILAAEIMAQSGADTLHVKADAAAVETLYRRGLTWVSFRPVPDRTCGIDFTIRKLPELGLLAGTVQGVRHEHMSNAENDDGFFSLHINLSGLNIVRGRGREFELRDGDAMLFDCSISRSITRPGLVDHRIVRLPRSKLMPLVPNIEDALLRPIPRGTGALNLLAGSIATLIDDPTLTTKSMRLLITNQLCDLVAVTLGGSRDAIAVAEGRGVRAARLNAIKSDIEAHLTDSELSPLEVARRHRISDSYIRKLFESEGTSFSQFVLTRRLRRAHRLLTNRLWAERSILTIAQESGFGDLSYFNRTFKRHYGATPSAVRWQDSR